MNRIIRFTFISALVLLMVFTATGCNDPNKSGNTFKEPEITVEYLSTGYAEQLMRDGATYIFGTIEVVPDENGNPFLVIAEKEYVKDQNHPKGYYIADKNMSHTYPLSFEARSTHLSGDTSIPNIMTSENFVKAVASDLKLYGESNPELSTERLYDIYVIGDQVEMILARYIP